PIVFNKQFDDPSPAGKIADITNGQDIGVAQRLKDLRKVGRFVIRNEQNMASLCLRGGIEVPDLDRMLAELFVTDDFLQNTPERVVAQNAYDDRIRRASKALGRPFGKLCEVVQEQCFELTFANIRLRSGGRGIHRAPDQKRECNTYCRKTPL